MPTEQDLTKLIEAVRRFIADVTNIPDDNVPAFNRRVWDLRAHAEAVNAALPPWLSPEPDDFFFFTTPSTAELWYYRCWRVARYYSFRLSMFQLPATQWERTLLLSDLSALSTLLTNTLAYMHRSVPSR